jgi:hypothetical protein
MKKANSKKGRAPYGSKSASKKGATKETPVSTERLATSKRAYSKKPTPDAVRSKHEANFNEIVYGVETVLGKQLEPAKIAKLAGFYNDVLIK